MRITVACAVLLSAVLPLRAADSDFVSTYCRETEVPLDAVHFAWAGGIERGQPHYYRLQGPRLLAEYDNTQRDVNHVHTVWRDPTADFSDDVLARHRAEFHSRPRLV